MLETIVEFLVKQLVEHPSSVRIVQKQEDGKIILTIHADEQDLGKVIGKGGQTIRSIRSLAILLNDQDGTQISVDVARDVAK